MRAVALLAVLCACVGCGATKVSTVVACAADGTCPAGSHCEAGLCQSGDPVDAVAGDGAGPVGGDTSADTGGFCLADLSGGPSPRGESFGGFADGRFFAISGRSL